MEVKSYGSHDAAMAKVSPWLFAAAFPLVASPLAACDPLRFNVGNDTAEPVRVDFEFAQPQSSCHAPNSLAGAVDVAAGQNSPFVCPPSEIAHISMTQRGRTCSVSREELVNLGRELTASSCLSGHPVRKPG